MDTLLFPITSSSQLSSAVDARPITSEKTKGSNFSEYMEKKLNAEKREGKNLLGADKGRDVAQGVRKNGNADAVRAESSPNDKKEEIVTFAELFSQFVQELREMAENEENGPGDWTVFMLNQAALEKIAAHAGIDETQLAALREQLESNGGKMSLADFLSVLARNFEEKQDVAPVTVPETDLPFLQILLERMGITPEDLEKLSEQSVRGDNSLDLEKFLNGLEEISGGSSTKLSEWEAEQLQNLLSEAGVSEKLQRALLPERYSQWQKPLLENEEISLTLARLKNILRDGISEVNDSRTKIDIPAFLKDLGSILSQAGFEEKGTGWTPALQGAISSIYDKLMESVDLSRVQVKKIETGTDIDLDSLAEAEFFEELTASQQGADALDGTKNLGRLVAAEMLQKDKQDIGKPAAGFADQETQPGAGETESANPNASESVFAHSSETSSSSTLVQGQEARAVQTPRHFMSANLQQQTFDQISQGVMRGLRNNEHHLILKLHPRELGEVRVEMLVRDEQVAVSFSMENSKVKGILESNMDQFRDSLEKQGFVLGECMVSVNHDENGEQAWQQFEFAWKNSSLSGRKESLADLSQDVLYLKSQYQGGSTNGIDIFA